MCSLVRAPKPKLIIAINRCDAALTQRTPCLLVSQANAVLSSRQSCSQDTPTAHMNSVDVILLPRNLLKTKDQASSMKTHTKLNRGDALADKGEDGK